VKILVALLRQARCQRHSLRRLYRISAVHGALLVTARAFERAILEGRALAVEQAGHANPHALTHATLAGILTGGPFAAEFRRCRAKKLGLDVAVRRDAFGNWRRQCRIARTCATKHARIITTAASHRARLHLGALRIGQARIDLVPTLVHAALACFLARACRAINVLNGCLQQRSGVALGLNALCHWHSQRRARLARTIQKTRLVTTWTLHRATLQLRALSVPQACINRLQARRLGTCTRVWAGRGAAVDLKGSGQGQ